MNVLEFNFEPLNQRFENVLEQGNFLAYRLDGAYRINLYEMGGFFAEVWYKPGETEIKLVLGFSNMECLEPYLDLINLPELIDNNTAN